MDHLEGNDGLLVVEEFFNCQDAKNSNWETFFSSITCESTCFQKWRNSMCLCVNRVTEVFCSVVSGTLQENKGSGELKHPVTSAHVVNAQTHTKQLK